MPLQFKYRRVRQVTDELSWLKFSSRSTTHLISLSLFPSSFLCVFEYTPAHTSHVSFWFQFFHLVYLSSFCYLCFLLYIFYCLWVCHLETLDICLSGWFCKEFLLLSHLHNVKFSVPLRVTSFHVQNRTPLCSRWQCRRGEEDVVRFTWLMFVLISACTLTSLPECHIRSIDLVHLDHFLVKLKDVYLMLKRHLCLYLNFRAMTGIAEI